MPPRPNTHDGSAWQPVSTAGLVALIGFALFLMRWMKTDTDGFLVIVDSVNLAIHEFGHPFFGIFGEVPQWWGGTWMELLVPAVICGVFIYQRSALSAAFAGIWFFENFHYISVYIADASTEALPLAGGGEHDWNWLLTHYGHLHADTEIAAKVNAIAYVGIVACLVFAAAVWVIQRSRQQEAGAPQRVASQHFEI
jgi:hypothetical protein